MFQVTWADLTLFNFYEFARWVVGDDHFPDCPQLALLHEKVGEIAAIKEYVQKRANTRY